MASNQSKLIILHLPEEGEEAAEILRVIADQVEEGYVSGKYGETVWDFAPDFMSRIQNQG